MFVFISKHFTPLKNKKPPGNVADASTVWQTQGLSSVG
jgi:hypothetical protein